jgi:hypothetical protein
MLKQPSPSMPGMTDTLDFVKNLWGSMHIPGANMPGMPALGGPPMSIEDLDKRIADMKAVESWLNLNLSMLHGTIQALEVQRGTLATLRSMSTSMAEALRQSGVSTESMAAMPFASFFGAPAQGAGAKSATPAAAPAAPAAAAPAAPQSAAQSPAPSPETPGAATGMPAAMAWWNILQDQFTQAVTTAMTPAAGVSTPSTAPSTAPATKTPQAPAAKAETRPEPAKTAPPDGAQPGAGGNGNGNGRARAGRPKADKG